MIFTCFSSSNSIKKPSFKYFPKSFDISVEGKVVKSVKEATDLNGENKSMIINFSPILARKVRFTQTGKNWDQNDNFLFIKGIEILSSESKYSKGVFAKLVNECENRDPHTCPVIISSTNFDFNSFYLIDQTDNICTYAREKSWFQVELTRGTAILNGFRLKRSNPFKMRNYKIICTDDLNKPESDWKTLIEINEKTENEHKVLDIYEFAHPSPPVRFIKLIATGPDWDNDLRLRFYHFDLFGTYF